MPTTILIVEDEKNTREGLLQALGDKYDVYSVASAEDAFPLMDAEEFDVILTDLKMSGKSGLMVIDKAVSLANKPICIMMTAYGNIETAVEAMKRGAFDFLTKPINLDKLEMLIQRALKSRLLEVENKRLHERLDKTFTHEGIIGNSETLKAVLEKAIQVAPTKASVLLNGETGTGKEHFAQLIHQHSTRSEGPFIAVHCAALSSNLLESELFGFEKGAFTGASQKRIGRFEAADGGTLFLDEIGEIDAATQVKLLRFLETKSFERLGSNKSITVDIRLVCATHRKLEKMVQEGTFREDLFYRLNVVTIKLPSLAERQEDIPVLIEHFIQNFSQENSLEPLKMDKKTLAVLKNYAWPGNIRELRNFCENAVIMKPGGLFKIEDLSPRFFDKNNESPQAKEAAKAIAANQEKNEIQKALNQAKGNRTQAATILGISRRTLHRKLEQWPELSGE